MIRVNLLPVREARKQAGLRQQVVVLGLAAIAGVMISMWAQMTIASKQNAERALVAAARIELAALEATRKEVNRFREEREEIERKLQVIENLEKNRTGPVRVMDQIASIMPKRMWLTHLSMKKGAMKLEGVSLDAEIVAAFLMSLSEASLISHVELERTKLEEKDGFKLNSFSITSRYEHGEVPEISKPNSRKKNKRKRS